MEQADLLAYMVNVFDRLSLRYFLTGSVATSYYGEPRFTNDIDLIAEVAAGDIPSLCQAFPDHEFYLSEPAARAAVQNRRQFNILHPTSGLKVDVFVPEDSPFERSRMHRRQRVLLQDGLTAWIASPEDVIIKKLIYYTEGGSDKHVRDIFGVLKINQGPIDLDYIAAWAGKLGLLRLWQTLLAQAATGT